jgi:signal transduction histidine kinase
MVSHDLKNPLQIIISQTELLRRRITRGHTLPEQLNMQLAAMDATAEKMVRQIDGLLDLTRLQAGQRIVLQREPVDLVALARQLLDEHQPTTDRHQLVLDTALPELIGWWDRERLERAIANLLGNAIKYSPGGGTITVHLAEVQDTSGAQASVAVQDQGIGIPTAEAPQLFERYRRASNVIQGFAGTGVGLASARWIVEEHGGMIDVVSEDGAGSTFTIRLPLQPAHTAPQMEAR